eukprot:TRINITY_DN48909_c0_g1_i1.p1 TRINITY_DN48909_c0_g1~~TRINITY_DN48909_c0_g1_i1.p1  ORF type:complete len:772 (+),score=184.30 TRINITY_DN48909_c0_g1_i1:96-2411(+)
MSELGNNRTLDVSPSDAADALSARVGRFEAELEALRREVLVLQNSRANSVADGLSIGKAEDLRVSQWVRLFERELEAVRRVAESFEEPMSILEHRVTRLESVGLPQSGVDLDELAEVVLAELQDLQEQVGRLARPDGTATLPLQRQGRGSGSVIGPDRSSVAGLAAQRLEKVRKLEKSAASAEARLESLEREVLPATVAAPDPDASRGKALAVAAGAAPQADDASGSRLAERLRQLEAEVQLGMQPLRQHQVSLKALEETNLLVQKLQASIEDLPRDQLLQQTSGSVRAFEEVSHRVSGPLSLLDSCKVQASLDQVMTAMETLVRQRNADVQLVNSYLEEVYHRIERDLPSDKGQSIIQSLDQLQSLHGTLRSECRAVSDVLIPELEARLLQEISAAATSAEKGREELAKLEEVTKGALDQITSTQAALPGLQGLSERRVALESRREAEMAELRKEITSLRADFHRLSVEGGAGPGTSSERLSASLTAFQTTILARLEREAKEAGSRDESLQRQLVALQDRVKQAETAGGGAENLQGDLQLLAQDFATLRGEASRADVELRERISRSERELKAEIRASQRLLLEVAESSRRVSPERAAVPPISDFSTARLPEPQPLPALAAHASNPSAGVELDVGTLRPAGIDSLDWSLPGVRARARFGNAQPLISPTFALPQFPEVQALRLKLFPLGSRRRTKAGHCSIYLTGPQGAHLQFVLRMGNVEHGPLECVFDRPEKDSGRHDFCELENELEVDGSALVRLTVLSADIVPLLASS